MESRIDLRILETLSSKICHDLINPISAINNGIELIEDASSNKAGTAFSKEALEMIEFSGEQASKRILVFRIAYGQLLSSTAKTPFPKVTDSLKDFFSNSRIALDVDQKINDASMTTRVGFNRIFVNAVMLSFELLQIEGEISAKYEEGEDDAEGTILITVSGKHKEITDKIHDCLSFKNGPQDICVQSITPYILGLYAEQFEAKLGLNVVDDTEFTLKISFY